MEAAGAEDFTEAAEGRSAGAEVSTAEVVLGSEADATSADFVAATSAGGAPSVVAAVSAEAAGVLAEDLGAEDLVTDGAGDLALGGRIMVGAIRMAITARGITRPTLILITRSMVLRTIPRARLILTTGTTVLHRRIPMHGPDPTGTDLQAPGDPRYREAERMQTTQIATSGRLRRAGGCSPLTG
jgi:hypothetical protein